MSSLKNGGIIVKKSIGLLLAACLVVSVVLAGCTQNDPPPPAANLLEISDEYVILSVNGFETTWSQTEDGTDWVGSIEYMSDDTVTEGAAMFSSILGYVNGKELLDSANSGNFTADFSFMVEEAGPQYDFKFYDTLVLRTPEGDCFAVNLGPVELDDLRSTIENVRIMTFPGNDPSSMSGAWSEDREPNEEDLAVFSAAIQGSDLVPEGVTYAATLVSSQVVAGMNYRFTATAMPEDEAGTVLPEDEHYTVEILIFQPLMGEPPVLQEIVEIE